MIKKSVTNDIIGLEGLVRKKDQKNLTKDLNIQKRILHTNENWKAYVYLLYITFIQPKNRSLIAKILNIICISLQHTSCRYITLIVEYICALTCIWKACSFNGWFTLYLYDLIWLDLAIFVSKSHMKIFPEIVYCSEKNSVPSTRMYRRNFVDLVKREWRDSNKWTEFHVTNGYICENINKYTRWFCAI